MTKYSKEVTIDKLRKELKELSDIEKLYKAECINWSGITKDSKEEYSEIIDLQEDRKVTNEILIELVNETGDKYIETDYIITSSVNKIPNPLTKEEVRDIRINIINNNN